MVLKMVEVSDVFMVLSIQVTGGSLTSQVRPNTSIFMDRLRYQLHTPIRYEDAKDVAGSCPVVGPGYLTLPTLRAFALRPAAYTLVRA